MFKLEFGIVHRGCLVNRMSRAHPELRIISAGGFTPSPDQADEILIFEDADDDDLHAALGFLRDSGEIAELDVVERTPKRAYVRILTNAEPETGYCSDAVKRHRGFSIGMEVQTGGVEQWVVGCRLRTQADELVAELEGMGELRYQRVSEVSWDALVGADGP